MSSLEQSAAFLETLRSRRLESYRSTPEDVNAHYSDEGQIQADYHKRFAFELIQNADDAMQDIAGTRAVRFELDGDTLLVANTGRPIDEEDVRALCTMSYTTKGADGERRASIGHKGRGFSSVLDITNQPQVFSTSDEPSEGISFEFDRNKAKKEIQPVIESHDDWSIDEIEGYPLMRLPFPPESVPDRVRQLLDEEFNTVFHFELKDDQIRRDVVETVSAIDRNTTVFLRELERLELVIDGREEVWSIQRNEQTEETNTPPPVFVSTTYSIDGAIEREATFALFRREDIRIGEHTGGIDDNTWGKVEFTEVGLALPVEEDSAGVHLRRLTDRPDVHVFLPTSERCPIPVLINGAFHTAISRTNITVTSDEDNYNAFLLSEVANLIATDVRQFAEQSATTTEELIKCLDFTHLDEEQLTDKDSLTGRFVAALKNEIRDVPLVPRFGSSKKVHSESDLSTISDTALPYYSDTREEIAPFVARIHGAERVSIEVIDVDGWFPTEGLLTPSLSAVLYNLGAEKIESYEIPAVLGAVPDARSPLNKYPEPEDELAIDPILQVLVWIWETISDQDDTLERFQETCQRSAVFPVGTPTDRTVEHVSKPDDVRFFFPPREELPPIDLSGIQFLTPPVYRPQVGVEPKVQSRLVEDLKPALESIWDVSDFDFEEVLQAAVYPKLPSPRQSDSDDTELRDIRALDLVRRLGANSIDASAPLPYIERSVTVHRLCLLPVPTRDGEWQPAYRVYFGEEWQPEESKTARIEPLLESAAIDASYLAGPERFLELADFPESESNREDVSAFDEWKSFFEWLGVAGHVRPTTFFDPKDRRRLKSTIGMDRPDNGSVLNRLSEAAWQEYRTHLQSALDGSGKERREYDSIYRVHGLEYFNDFVNTANENGEFAEQFFVHIARWWPERLQAFQHPILATHDVKSFNRRNHRCPNSHEQRRVGTNLWLWQLKETAWCPTNRGRAKPESTWRPTESIRRQFTIEGESLVPVLPNSVLDVATTVPGLIRVLGIRQDVSQETFRPRDAELVVEGLTQMFNNVSNDVIADSLRQIKPVYRYVSRHLPGLTRSREITDETWAEAQDDLGDIPVLCRSSENTFEFVPAHDALFVRSPEVLGRIPITGVPVFVLQDELAISFGTHFGMRDLEERADASSTFSDERSMLTEDLRTRVEHLAPYVLCRLEAERQSQELIDQDLTRMESFLDTLAVVDEIEVTYEFESGDEPVTAEPEYYLDDSGRSQNELPLPYVRTADRPDTLHRHVARALCEFLEVTQFEGIITLLNETDDEQRREYLRLAGAPATAYDVENKRQSLLSETRAGAGVEFDLTEIDEDTGGFEERTERTGSQSDGSEAPSQRNSQQGTMHPVYDPEELLVDGSGITIETTAEDNPLSRSDPSKKSSRAANGGDGGSNGTSVSQDYRTTVDRVGTAVAKQYEHDRLKREFSVSDPSEYVFDVHEGQDVLDMYNDGSLGGSVLKSLHEEVGLPKSYPGFDILTVNPETHEADRLIELKSSGNDTRTPGITWNEWKTAATSAVSERFYLYIVANLRKDVSADPYLRAIPNPFHILNSQTQTHRETKREVKVDVTSFKREAEIREAGIQVRPVTNS